MKELFNKIGIIGASILILIGIFSIEKAKSQDILVIYACDYSGNPNDSCNFAGAQISSCKNASGKNYTCGVAIPDPDDTP